MTASIYPMAYRRQSAVLVLFLSILVAGPVASPAFASSAAPGTAQPRASGSWDRLSYGGISLSVPASWPVINLTRHPSACPRLDRHAVYLGTPGPDPVCPAGLTGKTGTVQILPVYPGSPDAQAAARPAVLGGERIRTTVNNAVTHSIIEIIPVTGLEVSLSYGNDLGTIRRIQSSIRVSRSGRRRKISPALAHASAVPRPLPAQGLVRGAGFDTCAAPSAAVMRGWLKSPYRAIGVYIGGVNRGCAQANLSAAWLRTIHRQGWHYWPYYVGLQADCVLAYGDATIVPAQAAAEGRAAAQDAVQQARSLGIPRGTPIIYDMEAYAGCGQQVITFLSAWDSALHTAGYLAGVYESFSNIGDLVSATGRMTEPDVINYADWDGQATTASSYMPSTMWTRDQRVHQYLGGHNQTFSGATLNIDSDQLDVRLGGGKANGGGGGGLGWLPLPGFGIAIGMNSNGSAEWFARAANGSLVHAWQHPIGSTQWVTPHAVGDSPRNLISNPAVASDASGVLTLFAISSAGSVTHAWQQPGQPDDWAWGGPAGTGPPGLLTGDPAAVTEPDGVVSVFVTDTGGTVMTTSQTAADANRSWTRWASIGGSCASSPAAVRLGASVLVACTTPAGTLAAATLTGGSWSAWQQAGPATRLTSGPVVIADPSGVTEMFAATRAGRIVEEYSSSGQGTWTQGAILPSSDQVTGTPSVTTWPGGGVAVFSQLAGGQAGYTIRDGPVTAPWSGWTNLGSAMTGSPAAWRDSWGEPQAAVLTPQRTLAVTAYANGSWLPWTALTGGF